MIDWFILAATSWPDAAIAIFGIVFVMVVASVAIWQVFGTGRTAIASKGVSPSCVRTLRSAISRP